MKPETDEGRPVRKRKTKSRDKMEAEAEMEAKPMGHDHA